ncbi:hypothetical protein SARC_02603 [Sphaeroforma arctica JP610]|uniref:Solute-binding protein family 3/N-terminal domain-containing protein n=1 Tax=Sphaeroforma arctica JP610 TaxID=667725 RepID=A0A0L0GAB4_9EUKA|nr:hypothetical protein SARC_02603 [Sphaeroforma arctica JP610]KNC85183.1 hypothetical protein SARC_02603 [Sphaeroforma arctica JP610]|eukprot:XP_014159085.1 hypothetical protein SARC_02603 [Sphaeroforma arctica JP610]
MNRITMTFQYITISACLCAIASAAPAVNSTSVLDTILSRGELLIGVTGDYIPFSFLADGVDIQDVAGADVDLGRALAASLGVNATFVQTSWPTLLEDLHAGLYDIGMSGITKTLVRQQVAYLSDSYMDFGKMAVVRCEDGDKYASLDDLNQPTVTSVANPGGTNEKFQLEHLDKTNQTTWPDNRSIYDRVAEGHADVFVSDSVEVLLHVDLDERLCAPIEETFTQSEMGFLLPRDDIWLNYVNLWLHQEEVAGSLTMESFIEKGEALYVANI